LCLFLFSEPLLLINLQVAEWLEYAPMFLSGSEFENACSFVDGYLISRTFLVGHGLTIADIAVWSNLAGKLRDCLPFFFQAGSGHRIV
jgi:glutathione S-transferase